VACMRELTHLCYDRTCVSITFNPIVCMYWLFIYYFYANDIG
jgi:hypothetical protein